MCKELLLTLHLLSHHHVDSNNYNNANYGAGVECRQEGYAFAAGVLNNSYKDTSAYVFGSVDVLNYKRLRMAVVGGLLSGYKDAEIAIGEVLPMVGLRSSLRFGRVEPALLITPLYVHTTLSISFGD